MAKRFTDTEKWRKKFIKTLSPTYKLFFLYLLDDCNHAGIWHVEPDVASLRIGEEINIEEAKKCLGKHIIEIDHGEKWFIPYFIEYQYGELHENNRAHNSVLQILNKYDLINKGLVRGLQDRKDMDKDKDKDKEKVKDIYEYWNKKRLIKHTKLTDRMKQNILTRLKDHSVEEIKTAIDRYDEILNDRQYWLEQRWTIELFMSQKNALPNFLHDYYKTNYKKKGKDIDTHNHEYKLLNKFKDFGEFIDYYTPYQNKGTYTLLPYPKKIKDLAYAFINQHIRLDQAVEKWEELRKL